MPVDVLAIAAHPEDVELTCGGTLASLKARGYRFGIVDLTRGEMGTRETVCEHVRTLERRSRARARFLRTTRLRALQDPESVPQTALNRVWCDPR